ncbi:hydantoinase/oxoprolinase N-terminal domain-containing protein [Actinophytocola sp.]|uniref:hydantoinase/oxoprolinase N-terminal domain-containing protein n=1 Tax=Actinophytocola sp. TaxID=1872138 RepID=UPI002D5F942E|nr:hydantoinase/oxoprolinase N-terminal domain-containing protein [Actinophytocola sp.]HYQ66442.1 hydantoinase/oxoprolinase N-terminal domain-containing protein [Actinophytocola sp.]
MPDHSYRLGIALDGDHVSGALADADGDIVAVTTHRLDGCPTPDGAVTAVLYSFLANGGAVRKIDRVAFAISELDKYVVFPQQASADHHPWSDVLGPIAVLRLGAATTAVPPLALWPRDFRDQVVLASTTVAGGARLDGTELEPLDEDALTDFARSVAGRVKAVAVTGVFATLTPDHELAAAAILERELGGVPLVLSHEIGGNGLLERENATVLQAALTLPAGRDAAKLQDMLVQHDLGHAEVFFARNDGTIAAIDHAATHPLALYGGSAAATVRGAARLAGEQDALVALTNGCGVVHAVCAVTAGQPRLTAGHTTIAGVPTSLRVIARVPVRAAEPTTVDVRAMTEAVDRAKIAPGDLPLLLGGPGAEDLATALPLRLTGTLGVRCPPWASAAAAVGVATAPVGGEAERIMPVRGAEESMRSIREAVSETARAAAVRAGADPQRARTKLIEETPLSYLSEPAVALRARAEGPPRPGVATVAGDPGTRRVATR